MPVRQIIHNIITGWTLAKIAAEQAGRRAHPARSGPHRDRLGGIDEAALAKGLLDAATPFKVVIRGGAIGGRTIDADGVTRSRRCRRATCCSPSWPAASRRR